MPAGRPKGSGSLYTPQKAEAILARLRTGEPLTVICADEGMPCDATVRKWEKAHLEFGHAVARARESGVDFLLWSGMEIVDDARNDWMERREARDGKPERETFNAEHVQRSKIRAWYRLELAKKFNPKKYADNLKLTDGEGKPLQGATVNLSGLTPEQVRAVASIKLEGDS